MDNLFWSLYNISLSLGKSASPPPHPPPPCWDSTPNTDYFELAFTYLLFRRGDIWDLEEKEWKV